MVDFDLPIDFDFIQSKNKEAFKKVVKVKAKEYALRKLLNNKSKHSKMNELWYTDMETQEYFKNTELNLEDIRITFRYRTRMENFGENFRGGAPM